MSGRTLFLAGNKKGGYPSFLFVILYFLPYKRF